MELYEEQVTEQKKSKIPVIIGVCITILIIITILLICGIIYLKGTITTIQINGEKNYEIEEIIYVEESAEGGLELYIPIIKMADFLGYEGFSGDYINKSEDKTKCHVISENEVAMFSLNSEILVKKSTNSEVEYITIDKPVFEKDGELYTTVDGIEKAFNVLISKDENLKNIDIYTMDYLITYYTTALKIETYSTNFIDQKAIFEDMIIIQDGNQYGVISATTGKAVLETKYEEISYLPVTKDFIVKSNGKYGIVTKEANVKVRTVYDSIKIIDNKNGLYLVNQNNFYGVINSNGEIIIETEYKEIGINVDKYKQNGVENSYVLVNEIIPIKNQEGLWGFFNVKGQKISEFKYAGIGCTSVTANNAYPVLVVPSYNIIIVKQGNYYNLLTIQGKELAPENRLNQVYLKVNPTTEENQYFMEFNNKVVNIEEWLASAEE